MRRSKLPMRRLEDHFEILNEIGSGAYGTVYRARGKADRCLYAVKEMIPPQQRKAAADRDGAGPQGRGGAGGRAAGAPQKLRLRTTPQALREVKLLRELRHPNIVELVDQFASRSGAPDGSARLHIVYGLADTDLLRIIKAHRATPFDPSVVCWYLFQILRGCQFLHENWIVHRDIKPENMLVVKLNKGKTSSDGSSGAGSSEVDDHRNNCVKITDFGLARIFQSPLQALAQLENTVVTCWYRAPELLLGSKHYTTAVDIWAVGCIFAELINRTPLFPGKEEPPGKFQADQCNVVFRTLGFPTTERWPGVQSLREWQRIEGWASRLPAQNRLTERVPGLTGRARDLLMRMLELDPSKRITAEEALKHDYFATLRKDLEAEEREARRVERAKRQQASSGRAASDGSGAPRSTVPTAARSAATKRGRDDEGSDDSGNAVGSSERGSGAHGSARPKASTRGRHDLRLP